jgi:RNA polymerase sigma factor (sigma-70 family)
VIGIRSGENDGIRPLVTHGALQKRILQAESPMELKAKDSENGIFLLGNHNGNGAVYACLEQMGMYYNNTPFSGEEWYLIGLMEEDALLPDYVGAETAPSAETEALEREELRNLAEQKQILLLALLSLKDIDRELINALFFDGASTREYAQRMGVSQRAVIKRRDRILRDLKKFFENSSK